MIKVRKTTIVLVIIVSICMAIGAYIGYNVAIKDTTPIKKTECIDEHLVFQFEHKGKYYSYTTVLNCREENNEKTLVL